MTPAILVIEDELPMRRVLRTALGSEGYYVWEAGTKGEGLAAFARRAPQAILLDLGLPDGDGLDVIATIRAALGGPDLDHLGARRRARPGSRARRRRQRLRHQTVPRGRAARWGPRRAARRDTAQAGSHATKLEIGPLTIHPVERRVF